MIPLRDILPTRKRAWVTWGLILANSLVWLFEVLLGFRGLQDEFVAQWGMTPLRFFVEPSVQVWFTPLTSMFIHGGWLHVVGNMWFLWIFGDNVEDAFGHLGFAVFYLFGGLGAASLQFAFTTGSDIPMVGASGAIAAILAAYMSLYPFARIQTLLFFFVFVRIVEIPAFLFIFIWFLFQLLSGCTSIGAVTGTAWWAHIGGFIAGWLIARWWKSRRASRGDALPASGGSRFHFHVHRPRSRPGPDDLMPPGGADDDASNGGRRGDA